MGSSALPRHFQWAVILRALVLAALIVLIVRLLANTQLYATMLVVTLCAGLVIADLLRIVAQADRATQRFLESLAAGALETPVAGSATPERLVFAYGRAREHLLADRRIQHQGGEYLQTLLDTVPAALLVVHADGALRMINRAAHRLLGEAAPRLDQLATLGAVTASQLWVLPAGAQQIVRLANGRQLLASASQFSVPGGTVHRLISLQRLTGDLDAVEHKAWDDMARVLAHEMMNSLTPIASLSESLDALMRAGGHTEEVGAALEAIRRRSLGLMRFVDRYRKVAELPEPQLSDLPVQVLLQGVESLLAPALAQGNVIYTSTVSPPDLRMRCDADLLEQALINLLRNAIEAVAGEADARIDVRCGIEEGQRFIDVADTGAGLSAAAREQIFVPFFTTKAGGSGVGLSLARRIALAHGGQVTVRANEPQGTVFRLTIPA